MLRLVARETDTRDAFLGNVVDAARDAIFWIVALLCELLDLGTVDGHHLTHADVT